MCVGGESVAAHVATMTKNIRPTTEIGRTDTQGVRAAGGSRLAGSGLSVRPQPFGMDFRPSICADTKSDGEACRARTALGTVYCYGHLRSRGEA